VRALRLRPRVEGVVPLPALSPNEAEFMTDPVHEAHASAIARAKQGDTSALHFLYVRYADDVYGFVNSIVRDRHEAEDITQNLFARLTWTIGEYDEREAPFSAWILRVARNSALDCMLEAAPVTTVA
jgi:RNA polymerase sigma-70 factor (ECF subfamily)